MINIIATVFISYAPVAIAVTFCGLIYGIVLGAFYGR